MPAVINIAGLGVRSLWCLNRLTRGNLIWRSAQEQDHLLSVLMLSVELSKI
jgi:hypothetical protein